MFLQNTQRILPSSSFFLWSENYFCCFRFHLCWSRSSKTAEVKHEFQFDTLKLMVVVTGTCSSACCLFLRCSFLGFEMVDPNDLRNPFIVFCCSLGPPLELFCKVNVLFSSQQLKAMDPGILNWLFNHIHNLDLSF
jgi:hypothetical protein